MHACAYVGMYLRMYVFMFCFCFWVEEEVRTLPWREIKIEVDDCVYTPIISAETVLKNLRILTTMTTHACNA